jgi:hypothetical protein
MNRREANEQSISKFAVRRARKRLPAGFPSPTEPDGQSVARVGPFDMRAQAEVHSVRRTDTPKQR